MLSLMAGYLRRIPRIMLPIGPAPMTAFIILRVPSNCLSNTLKINPMQINSVG